MVYSLLPYITDYLQDNRILPASRVNFWVTQLSCLALTFGTILLSILPGIGGLCTGETIIDLSLFDREQFLTVEYALALAIFSLGFNIRAPILAFLATCVDTPNMTAQLYTLLSFVESLAHVAGSPFIEWVWGRAVSHGGSWLVLQFLVIAASFESPQ